MKFSERFGYKKISNTLQTEEVNETLRNQLWNSLYIFIWEKGEYSFDYKTFEVNLWFSYFKKRLDELPFDFDSFLIQIEKYFFNADWYEVYDFLEVVLTYFENEELNHFINTVLENELSAYRFVNGVFTQVTNKQETEMLEEALTDNDFPNVKAHLQRALELLSDRKNPDYRNSIKESISAVESIAKEIAQKPKAELGDALKEIEKQGKLHGAMKKAFSNLYGFTSDANGIRHSLMEEPNLTADDAKFFLLSCTSFINYLKTKI
jgi:hypothetical protein